MHYSGMPAKVLRPAPLCLPSLVPAAAITEELFNIAAGLGHCLHRVGRRSGTSWQCRWCLECFSGRKGDRSILSALPCRRARAPTSSSSPLPTASSSFSQQVDEEQTFLQQEGPPASPPPSEVEWPPEADGDEDLVTRQFRARVLAEQAVARQQHGQAQRLQQEQAQQQVASSSSLQGTVQSTGQQQQQQQLVVPTWAAALDQTHRIAVAGGVFFCKACGAFSTTGRRGNLAARCRILDLDCDAAAAWVRARPQQRHLAQGRLPIMIRSWPDSGQGREVPRQVRSLAWSASLGWHSGARLEEA